MCLDGGRHCQGPPTAAASLSSGSLCVWTDTYSKTLKDLVVGYARFSSSHHRILGPCRQPSVKCVNCYLTISNNVRNGQKWASSTEKGGGQSSDNFGDLKRPPITQLSRSCLPAIWLPLRDLQMCPGGLCPISKKRTLNLNFLLKIQLTARLQIPLAAFAENWNLGHCAYVTVVLYTFN